MQGFNYTELVAALQSWPAEGGAGTDYVDDIPRLIQLGELRLIRDLNLEIADYEDTTMTVAQGDRMVAKPDGMLSIRDLLLVLSTGEEVQILQRAYAYCKAYAPDPSVQAQPKFYAEFDDQQIMLVPTPDDDYSMTARGVKRPVGLSSTNANTWLGDNYGDLLFDRCLMEAEHWLKADDRYADIKGKYDMKLPIARAEVRNLIRAGDYSPYKGSAKEAK